MYGEENGRTTFKVESVLLTNATVKVIGSPTAYSARSERSVSSKLPTGSSQAATKPPRSIVVKAKTKPRVRVNAKGLPCVTITLSRHRLNFYWTISCVQNG